MELTHESKPYKTTITRRQLSEITAGGGTERCFIEAVKAGLQNGYWMGIAGSVVAVGLLKWISAL